MPDSQPIDKQHLYGEYTRTERWRDALSKRLAHKALDIPDDEMQINVDKSKKGLGAKELIAMGVLVAGGAYGGSLLTRPPASVPLPEPVIVQQSLDDTDTINVIGFAE